MPYKIGHCVKCKKQTAITDTFNRPIRRIAGTKTAWLKLSYSDNRQPTRIGTFDICADCDIDMLNVPETLQSLIDGKVGLSGDEVELGMSNRMEIELARRYD